ncbi:MAG: threonylcarbamoyl-AMP synthase [Bacteroidales bacterium]|jgi:L-threonylcarbamoyladenylate synthase|nr:threonylcarbamoyl-AMP synthase [Bacteroidales bacterium]
MTQIFDTNHLAQAASVLRDGGLVAFPTETVYGLGADATNDAACEAIYIAKGRPNDNPFIVHVCDISSAEKIALVCPLAQKLFEQFSPGPITIVMKKKPAICDIATAGLNSVGVRIPAHPVAQEFLKLCGIPVAAPSANISGLLSPTTADMVLRDLSGRIDGIIVSDNIDCGLESTVVSVLDGHVKLLRSGAISLEQLEHCLDQKIEVADNVKIGEIPRSPGQKHKHYSPAVPLELVEFSDVNLFDLQKKYANEKVGILFFENLDDYARNLYQTMDEMGRNGCVRIIAVLPENTGIGRAIRNRLIRASGK